MWPFKKPMNEVEALDRELNRLHDLLGVGDKTFNGEIYRRIKEIEDMLIAVARKKSGMEW